jgi:hypothetical protein
LGRIHLLAWRMRQKPIGKFKPPRSILAHRASQAHRDGARSSNPLGRLGSRSHRCRSAASGFAYRRFSSANEKCLFNCLLKVGNELLVA